MQHSYVHDVCRALQLRRKVMKVKALQFVAHLQELI
jgi:hypothetical protein